MGDFFAELRRRHIYRIGAGYVIAAWAVVQVLDVLSQLWALPDWIAQPITIVLAIGFPITLITAWLIEGKAHEAVVSVVRSPATAIDYILAGGLALVLGVFSYQQLTAPTGVQMARESAGSQDTAVAVAALPFANLSGDPQQESFADGITDEISSALASIPDLTVVARRSAYQFKGQNADMQTIGQALNATHLIDGTVRRNGDEVRITAQLVEATNGTEIWSDVYNREVADVFAIQEEIATAVAVALGAELGLDPGERLIQVRTNDPEVYEDFLRARALYQARALGEAIRLFESVIEREPDYAPAWALLSISYLLELSRDPEAFGDQLSDEGLRRVREAQEKSEFASVEAIRLDPRNPNVLAARAYYEASIQGRRVVAEDLYQEALSLDATDATILDRYAILLVDAGRLSEAIELRRKALELEPLDANYNIRLAVALLEAGPNQEGLQTLEAIDSDDEVTHSVRTIRLAEAYADLGRYNDAADALLTLRSVRFDRSTIEQAAQLLRSAGPEAGTPRDLPDTDLGLLNWVFGHLGAPERVMARLEAGNEKDGFGIFSYWSPTFSGLRQSERFKNYIHASGLYDYWRERGFADLCRPIGDDDFECD